MIQKILNPILNIVRFHKKEMGVLVALFLFFTYLFFPFSDLGDLVTAKVSEQTQGQISIDFDTLDLSLIPSPGLSLSKVKIDTPYTSSPVMADSLSVSPSIPGLLAFKPGVNVRAGGFLGGNLELAAGVGEKTSTTPSRRKQHVTIDLSRINLGGISSLVALPLKFEGYLSGAVDSEIDSEFAEQPTGTIDLKSERTVMPEGNITTPFGPIGLPRVSLGDVTVQGQADKGQLEISKFIAGHSGGDLFASVTGHIELRMTKVGPNVQPQVGSYDLMVHLQLGDAVRQKVGAFLGILSNYQTANNGYAFRASAPNSYSPPNLTRLIQ